MRRACSTCEADKEHIQNPKKRYHSGDLSKKWKIILKLMLKK
jgi:hypothetical protein